VFRKIEEPGKGENNRFKRLVVKALNRSTLFASSSVSTAIIKPIILAGNFTLGKPDAARNSCGNYNLFIISDLHFYNAPVYPT
jgi:hypothetical protein